MSISRTCRSCGHPLPEHLTDGTCPSCGSVQAGYETPKASGTPAEREGDFVVRAPDDRTETHRPEIEIPSTIVAESPTIIRPHSRTIPKLPGYREIAWLNSGGMGDVYRGIQSGTERSVAIKVMRPGGSSYSQNRERFENEIRALGRVDHPGVVRVYECGECPQGPYFSMEFIEGDTLSRRVKRDGPLPPEEAVRIVRLAAEAVHCAHRVEVLHRDIKPSNIMLAPDGSVKVTDFGLAKHTDADDTDELTQTGVVIGTPSYIPPEQVDGKSDRVGPASDIYGLGGTLYHLLTGSPPHAARSPARSLRLAQFDDVVPAKDRRPELCPILNAIVEKSLARDPADRYDSAEQFASELENWTHKRPTIALPPTRRQRIERWVGRNRVAVALAVLVPLIAAAAAIAIRESDPKRRIEADLAAGRKVLLVGETGPPDWPKWHDWAIRSSQLGPSLLNDGTLGFASNPHSGLVLVADPQTNDYRFRADVCHVGGLRSAVGALTTNATAKIGLFWGSQTIAAGPAKAHLMFSIDYSDLPWKDALNPNADANGHTVSFHANCFTDIPNRELRNNEVGMKDLHRFRPADPPPGDWRTIEIEVRPGGVAAYWKKGDGTMKKLRDLDAAMLNESLASRLAHLNALPEGPWSAPAPWTPRQPLGIFAYNSTLAVKNAIVEPIAP